MQKRKNYLIKKKFQLGFLFKFIALLIVESILMVGLFMYISSDTLTTGYHNSILTVDKTQSFFLIPFILITLIIVIAIGMAGMVIFILVSHRIAGPMYRFEKTLEQIENGDLTVSTRLRKTDQLEALQGSLNTFTESLDKRICSIKRSLEEVEVLLSKAGDPGVIKELNEKINFIKKEINYFKVASDSK